MPRAWCCSFVGALDQPRPLSASILVAEILIDDVLLRMSECPSSTGLCHLASPAPVGRPRRASAVSLLHLHAMHVAGLAFVALFVAPRSSAAAIRDAGARGAGSVGQRRRKKQELAAITRVGIGPASTDQVLCTSVLSA